MENILEEHSNRNLMARINPGELQNMRRKNLPQYRLIIKRLLDIGDRKFQLKIGEYILRTPSQNRLEEEIQLLQKATEGLHFFQDLNSKKGNVERKLHYLCCQKMSYQFFKQGEIIFKFNDPSDKFFIILDGNVNIFLPIDIEKIQLEVSRCRIEYAKLNDQDQRKHAINLIQRAKKHKYRQKLIIPYQMIQMLKRTKPQKDIFKNQVKQDKPLQSLNSEIAKMESNIDKPFAQDQKIDQILPLLNLEELERKIHYGDDQVHDDDLRTNFESCEAGKNIMTQTGGILPFKMNNLDYFFVEGVMKFQLVDQLSSGMMFGELGILMNKPRSASIVAKTTTHVAVMQSDDYKFILQEAQHCNMDQKISFFMDNFFQSIPKNIVMKYSYNFKKIKLTRGVHLYQEGEESKMVYLIKKGDLQMYRNVVVQSSVNLKQSNLKNAKNALQLVKMADENSSKLVKLLSHIITLNICNLTRGQVVGEQEIMLKTNRKNSVVVLSNEITLYSLNAGQYLKILSENITLKKRFMQSVKLKQEWESEKFQEMLTFQEMSNGQILSSQADARSKLAYSNESVEQLKVDQFQPHRKPELIQVDIELDEDVHDLQKNSTKNILERLRCQVKIEKKMMNNYGGSPDQLQLGKEFQKDLMELQRQRRTPHIQGDQHTQLKVDQYNTKTHAQQQRTENSIQNYFKTKLQERKYHQTEYPYVSIQQLNVETTGMNSTYCQSLNKKQEQILKNMQFIKDHSTYQIGNDGIKIKSFFKNVFSGCNNINEERTRIRTIPLSSDNLSIYTRKGDLSENRDSKSRALITSKHNQFRFKPDKHFLLTKYEKGVQKRPTYQNNLSDPLFKLSYNM